MKIDVDLGSGNDTFVAALNGRNIENSSTLDLKAQGGWGRDSLTVDAEGTDTNRVHVRPAHAPHGVARRRPTSTLRRRGHDQREVPRGFGRHPEPEAVGGQGDDTINALLTLSGGSDGG